MQFTIAYYGSRLNADKLMTSPRNRNSMLKDSKEN